MRREATGERMVVGEYRSSAEDYVVYLMHVAAYRYAEAFTRDRRVLDYGCGTGYGAARIAEVARRVEAVDVDEGAIAHACREFRGENLAFACIDPGDPLPYRDGAFDTVLSFQVLEHLDDVPRYLSEARRVLAPGGTLVLATPDRRERLLPWQKPWNRWHVREFDERTLRDALSGTFADVEVQSMSGRRDVIGIELSRCRRLKWLTLPVTLPVIPDRLRVRLLGRLRALRRAAGPHPAPPRLDFDDSAIAIGPGLRPSLNLVAIARA